MAAKKLYLIDGANYVYRAYYAIRSLSTSKGFPTNALYGFTQMLLKLLRDEKPDHIAVVFDTAEPTFRDEMYKDYKANRPPPPDDLVQQFPHFKPILEALNIPVLELPGFEADDIIGTLAKKLASDDLDVVIVSGDKDLMQLVGNSISMFDSMKDRRIGEKQVEEQFGVKPRQVIDVLGLAGDSSDNVPGVSGIGQVTASKLVAQYGSVEGVIEHANELSKGIAEKITRDADKARLSKELVTIKTDVPVKYNFDDFAISSPDDKKLHDIFREFEFLKLLSEMSPKVTVNREGYRLIQNETELNTLIEKIKDAGSCSFDLETTSLDVMEAEIVGISVAISAGAAAYIPVGHIGEKQETGVGVLARHPCESRDPIQLNILDSRFRGNDATSETGLFPKWGKEDHSRQLPLAKVLEELNPVLSDPAIKKIGQNLKYDLAVLKRYDVSVDGLYCDTMIASYLLNPSGSHGLDAMALQHLDHTTIHYEDVVGKGKKQKCFSEVDVEVARDYSCEDADVALRLADIFIPKLKEANLADLFWKMEMPLLAVLLDMEQAGMKIDVLKLASLSRELDVKLKDLEKKIYEEAKEEFNINSPRQLGVIIFDKLKLGTPKRTKTGYSTDVGVLEDLALRHPLPALILEYRSLSKLKSTYIDALPELVNKKTGRLHTSLNQTVTATGRLSSSNPNLQNIPVRTKEGAKIREAFIAEKGNVLISADYSQIELRVLAHLSKDEALLEAFRRGDDVHRITAAGIFGVKPNMVTDEQRVVGKTVNFATIYGQTAFGLSKQLKIEVDVAKKYIDAYFERYPEVERYRDKVIASAKKDGLIKTLFGRRRLVPDINSPNAMLKQMTERMAFNAVFQGTAADIIKKAMIEIHAELPQKFPNAKMIMQVHDELLFEAPEKGTPSPPACPERSRRVGEGGGEGARALAEFVKEKMEKVVSLDVPLIVDIGTAPNWSQAH